MVDSCRLMAMDQEVDQQHERKLLITMDQEVDQPLERKLHITMDQDSEQSQITITEAIEPLDHGDPLT